VRHPVGSVSFMDLVAIINIVLSPLIEYFSSTEISVNGITDDLSPTLIGSSE
jgi:hypothetical protein